MNAYAYVENNIKTLPTHVQARIVRMFEELWGADTQFEEASIASQLYGTLVTLYDVDAITEAQMHTLEDLVVASLS